MKGRKIIFLILALLVPGLVFVFLKMFGRNEFQVPVLHQESVPERTKNCDVPYRAPYLVADSIIRTLGLNAEDSLYVFNFDAAQGDALNRVSTEFRDHPVTVVDVTSLEGGIEPDFLRRCVLLMHQDSSAAIIDNRRRIRGYYDPRDRDEVDRMILEIKIMLKQY